MLTEQIKLKIDDELKLLVAPISEEALRRMERELELNGCSEPLFAWYRTVLVDHDRYEICVRRQIPFQVRRVSLRNRQEAVVWICIDQLNRRDIPKETRKYLIGKRYETEKILDAHNYAGVHRHAPQRGGKNAPEEKLAEEYGISQSCILHYGRCARTMDALSAIVPQLIPKILSGEIKISQRNIATLSKLTGLNAKRLQRQVADDASLLDSGEEIVRLFPRWRAPVSKIFSPIASGSIKDMPTYDPDAEISNLVFTIPSWVSSIDRVLNDADFNNVTDRARNKLDEELEKLRKAVDAMNAAMKEAF